jgi:multiple sugar transport system permease protein
MPLPSSALPEARSLAFPSKRSITWREMRRSRSAYLFISPFFAVFAAFMLLPICFSFYLSFQKWNGIMAPTFVGLRHYWQAFHDPGLLNALKNTVIFTVLTVLVSTAAALGLALFLNSVQVLKRFFRGVFFIPAIVSLVVVALVWKLILNSEIGLFHELIRMLGHGLQPYLGYVPHWTQQKYHFLDNPHPIVPLLTMTVVHVWAVIGFSTVIYLAGLQGVPSHLYEVARIDGATKLHCFRYITLPLLRPTTFFVVLISTIDAMQQFVLPNVMKRDSEATMTVVYYLYRNAFEFYKMGYASAIAYLLFGLTVLLGAALRAGLGRQPDWSAVE